MRRGLLLVSTILAASLAGCHKKRTLANFGLKPGLTIQQVEDQMGTPSKESPAWLAYPMEDGTELRLYFLEGQRGTERTLTEADIYDRQGQVTQVFKLHPTTQPATEPATLPTTQP